MRKIIIGAIFCTCICLNFGQELPVAPSVSKKFVALSVAGKAALVMDAVSTRQMLAAGYPEANPVLGRSPSNRRMIATGAAMDFGLDYLTYKIRHRRYWWVPRAVQIGMNLSLAANNWRLVGDRAGQPKGYHK